MPLFPSLPDDALVKDAYPLNPKLFRVWCEVEEGIMRGPSAFSPGQRELMGAFCSALNEGTYCQSSHWEAAVAFGIDRALFEPLMENLDSAPIEDNLKPVFRFLKKLTLTPSRMTSGGCRRGIRRRLGRKSVARRRHGVLLLRLHEPFRRRPWPAFGPRVVRGQGAAPHEGRVRCPIRGGDERSKLDHSR